jgi:molecular chaperone DnaK
LNEGGLDRLNAAAENLTKASHKIAETMYKAQQASAGSTAGGAGAPGAGGSGGPSGSSGPSGGGQGDVVDAEFVDVDDSKKPN